MSSRRNIPRSPRFWWKARRCRTTTSQPVITADFTQRVQTLSQEVMSPSRLRPVIQSLALVKPEEEGKLIEDIQQNMPVEPGDHLDERGRCRGRTAGAKKKKPSATDEPVPGFNVSYTDSNAIRAQKICNAMTSLIVDENLKIACRSRQSTTEFLGRQLEDAKRALDDQDAKLADFKKQYMGQFPATSTTTCAC